LATCRAVTVQPAEAYRAIATAMSRRRWEPPRAPRVPSHSTPTRSASSLSATHRTMPGVASPAGGSAWNRAAARSAASSSLRVPARTCAAA